MKTQKYQEAGRIRIALVLALLLSCLATNARAQISSTSGDVVAVTRSDVIAVGSLVEGAYTSDTEIRVFLEKEDYSLTSDMTLDVTADGTYNYPLTPGIVAAGQTVSSVMIHADRASLTGYSHLVGTIEFSSIIVGVVLEDETLDDWDPVVGLPPVTYPTGVSYRGLEVDDGAWSHPDEIVLNGNILELDFQNSNHTDQMRVILAGNARGVSFSIDFQGASLGLPATWGPGVIDEGDILTVADPGPTGPNGPVPGPTFTPGVMLEPADLGINVFGAMGLCEVDALSFGKDRGSRLRFSVDEFAVGTPVGPTPNVRTEGAMPGSNEEAAADVFAYRGPIAPVGMGFTPGNRPAIDGDGVAPTGRPGLGLVEPCPPTLLTLPDEGDNLDALDLNSRPAHLEGRIFFSLDAEYVDWAEAMVAPPNAGTAAANGVSPADILVTVPGSGTFWIYAYASDLGLSGMGEEDDVDAIAIWDDGDGEYEPGTDRILFSLRRKSNTLGMADCRLGLPITEADVLTPGPGIPCILIPGECLGLDTSRGGLSSPYQVPDDLDAMDRIFSRSAPVGNDDQAGVEFGGFVEINVLDNDFPLDGQLLPASIWILSDPLYGTIEHIDPETGIVTYQHDGSDQEQDSFSYVVFDDNGECTEVTTVFIHAGTSAVQKEAVGARRAVLSFASPNPFRSQIALRLQPAQTGYARVAVFDPAGRQVRLLLDEMVDAGASRELTWDGNSDAGQPTAAGIYIVHIRSHEGEERLRVVKMK